MKTWKLAALAAGAAAVVSTSADAKSASGSRNGLTWTAQSNIVGQTSTGTVASGGNPIYLAPNNAGYSGVVGLLMTYQDGSQFVCSGSLMNNRQSIVTAGHCVSDGAANDVFGHSKGLIRTQAIFVGDAANAADATYYTIAGGMAVPNAGTVAIDIKRIDVNQNYTGEVIDQNDIAVLTMAGVAPTSAQSYDLYTTSSLTGDNFNVAGYGTRSVVGGAEGTTGAGSGAGTGRRRQGDNRYDFAWGDADFNGFFLSPDANEPGCGPNWFCGTADIEFSYISDFDNGLPQNDTACRTINALLGLSGPKFCNTGLGPLEVSIAGGDSGGPAFIDGKLASVNSYGLTFGTGVGDFKTGLQSSWGEFNGFVPTFIHEDFIQGAMAAGVPEPASWAMMIAGFAMAGFATRRARKGTPILA
ncbi:PEPxxWA-CTERM sorting domain-containing protein [Sphingomonas sp.]|uniref:PEPxxWA-CTERM sorting domain-containing protein n=1 Tax=Sphingomonas sp. TaxID=28214 RepID=UPI002DBE69B1|nr:PEPxxWA-CTERM sorting domain-containing protein [Sphingomonas sp.]HEU4968506.1 PEPxxWA-CTERM sorting domain-containing protein [Sphingomonas sp.]